LTNGPNPVPCDHDRALAPHGGPGATADHIVTTSEDSGVDATLPRAIRSQYDRASAAGHGSDNWTALYEVIRPDR
jgi:hypothetical protein